MGSRLAVFLATGLLIGVAASGVDARNWLVPGEAPTIQAGIDSAAVGDTVFVACGVYWEHDIGLTPGVSLRSESGDPTCVTIDAQGVSRVMSSEGVSGATFVIEGITFTGGHAEGAAPDRWGGGLYCYKVAPVIRHCVFRGNSALPFGQGGGFFLWGLTNDAAIVDCKFIDNSADYGGGIRCYGGCDPLFSGCVVDSNFAQSTGAGVYANAGAAPSFSDCQVSNNHAQLDGAGIYASSNVYIDHCIISGNYTDSHVGHGSGGGIFVQSRLEMYSSTVVDNYAVYGGGIYILNCIWWMNQTIIASNLGGQGVYCANSNISKILNCNDIYGNVGGDWVGLIEEDFGPNGNISLDPLFCRDANPEVPYALHEGSPCLPDGRCDLQGLYGVACLSATAVDEPPVVGGVLLRSNCFPNPFNASTAISYQIAQPSAVRIEIFDSGGRLVFDDNSGVVLAPGFYSEEWRGVDAAGRTVASGLYHYRITAGGDTLLGRMMMIK